MKRRVLGILSAIICLGFVTISSAQQVVPDQTKTTEQWPQKVCNPIASYFAYIDAAGSIDNKAVRQSKYSDAKQSLVAALKPLGRQSLIEGLTEYQRITESMVIADPSKPGASDLEDKLLEIRTKTLGHCVEVKPGL
jgi:hypothetical protein